MSYEEFNLKYMPKILTSPSPRNVDCGNSTKSKSNYFTKIFHINEIGNNSFRARKIKCTLAESEKTSVLSQR